MEQGQGSVSSGGRHRQVPPLELSAPSPPRCVPGSHDASLPGLSRAPAALLLVPLLKSYSHSKATSSQLNTYLIIIRLGQLPRRDRMLRSTPRKAPGKTCFPQSCPGDVPSHGAGHGLGSLSLQRRVERVPGTPPALAMLRLMSRGYSV